MLYIGHSAHRQISESPMPLIPCGIDALFFGLATRSNCDARDHQGSVLEKISARHERIIAWAGIPGRARFSGSSTIRGKKSPWTRRRTEKTFHRPWCNAQDSAHMASHVALVRKAGSQGNLRH